MTERGDDIKATAEDLIDDAQRLKAIEETKSTLPADDPSLVTLSEEAADLTSEMAQKARVEYAIATEPDPPSG